MVIDKVVIALHGPLSAKYGSKGLASIKSALRELVAADKRRGIATAVVHLDDASDMAPYGGPVAGKPDARAVKAGIDKIASVAKPHYFLLLGGPDVLPMVPLVNPAYSKKKDGDTDAVVPSDLPYACDAAYSTNANRYLGPTRVVGRLPDLIGARQPTLLTQLIRAAARRMPRPRSDYQSSFGLSALAWQASTALSLTNTFGQADNLLTSPPKGPRWSESQLAPRIHFINCHGGDSAPEFYGQPPNVEEYPVSHRANLLKGKVTAGTVVAAECCYGAQLYDPADAGGQKGIALAYLEDGAAAVFGSTTIAYGPSEGNGSADLVCQYFIQQVLAGSSLGRAALEARQKFAGARTHLDPYDLKTLAQFYLLGDPSAQPVSFSAHALTRTRAFKKAFAETQDRTVRALRRERLEREGRHLARALPPLKAVTSTPTGKVAEALSSMAAESGLAAAAPSACFEIERKGSSSTRRIYVTQGIRTSSTAEGPVRRIVALIATEEDNQLLHVRRLHSH